MVDRVIALEIGRECQDVFARGRFSCILAKMIEEEEESTCHLNITTTNTTPTISPLAASFLSLILPPKLKYNLGRQHGDTLGAVVIDTLNQHLPPNKYTNKPRKDIAYLSNLAVHPSYRKSGVGRMLLVAAEKLARDAWGCRCIALHVDPDNSAAVELYKKNGYKVVMDQPEWQRVLEMRRRPLKLMMKRISGRERRRNE
jgi:ribosomal protein S18 acetylase RimI-like enzyme